MLVYLLNPDGYEYSRSTDRMWRKNRRKNENSKCVGVDLNRNFDKGFGENSSDDPCQEDYRGPEAFSEPEARALRDYVLKLQSEDTEYVQCSYWNQISSILSALSQHSQFTLTAMWWSFPGATALRSPTTMPRRWRGWPTRWSMTSSSSGTLRTGSSTSRAPLIRQFDPCSCWHAMTLSRCLTSGATLGAPLTTGTAAPASATPTPGSCPRRTGRARVLFLGWHLIFYQWWSPRIQTAGKEYQEGRRASLCRFHENGKIHCKKEETDKLNKMSPNFYTTNQIWHYLIRTT